MSVPALENVMTESTELVTHVQVSETEGWFPGGYTGYIATVLETIAGCSVLQCFENVNYVGMVKITATWDEFGFGVDERRACRKFDG